MVMQMFVQNIHPENLNVKSQRATLLVEGMQGTCTALGPFPLERDSHHKKSFLEDHCLCTVAVHTARVQALLWAPLFHQSHEAKHNLGCPELQGLVCVCIVLIYTARLPHGLTFL